MKRVSVPFTDDVSRKIRVLAAYEDMSMSEYLSLLFTPIINEEMEKLING